MNRVERRALERASKGHSKPPRTRTVWKKVDPIKHAMEGAAITPQKLLDQLALKEYEALDMFTRGQATLQEWSDLANVNNITQTLATMYVGIEALPDCHKAEEALKEAAARFQRTGKMGLTGPGIQAIREVLKYHDAQRSAIARSKYERAIQLTAARIKSGYATIDLAKTLGKQAEAITKGTA
jgi:hypothetical protein